MWFHFFFNSGSAAKNKSPVKKNKNVNNYKNSKYPRSFEMK